MNIAFGLKAESLIRAAMYSMALVVLYYASHSLMIQWWEREDYNYCYLMPLVVLYLLWEKRRQLYEIPSRTSWVGIIPLMVGLALFWIGELGGEYYIMYLSSWFALIGLCWLHLGWRKLRVILFPIGMILTMFPPPNLVHYNLSLQLKLISSKLGVLMLQMMGQSAYREGNVIDLGFTQLQVVDACSGIRYLFPLIVLAIMVSYYYRSVWWKKIVVILSAIPISIIVNGLRIASVGLLYPVYGAKVAEGFFHDFSGWAIFMVSLGLLLAELQILNLLVKRKNTDGGPKGNQTVNNDTVRNRGRKDEAPPLSLNKALIAPHFITAFLLIGTTAVIAQTIDFREARPMVEPFNKFPMRVSQWVGKPDSMDQKIINMLDASDILYANYSDHSGKNVNVYVAYYESQRKGESIHSPSSCLPGGGWVAKQSGQVLMPVSGLEGILSPVNRVIVEKGSSKQLTYYWFPMRGKIVTRMWEIKLQNFWDALTKQRTDGALVRLVTPIYHGETADFAETRLKRFLADIVPVLNGFLPQ